MFGATGKSNVFINAIILTGLVIGFIPGNMSHSILSRTHVHLTCEIAHNLTQMGDAKKLILR